ncbi:MAG: hypothetical protein QOG93_42, partial [Gaiellaceae bacterium]|nr:hypothetical protein [Gaiellaceae bacterium]
TVRAGGAETVEVRRSRGLETAAPTERLVRAVGETIQQEDDDRVHSDGDSLQRANHPRNGGRNERVPLISCA